MPAPPEAFRDLFDEEATHVVRAPGRVNLIGEHTDYNGLPVFPVALRQEVRIHVRAREDGRIRLHNARADFEPVELELSPSIEPGPAGHWGNYVRGVAQELVRRRGVRRGFDGLVEADLPAAAGLSSSSALVTAVGLALVHLDGVGDDAHLTLAELFAEAERYTGTRGGGMDQAISLAARAGCAALIEFDPLRVTHVPVPEDWCFVVADSGVRAEKSGPAQKVYNQRRAECEEAFERVAAGIAAEGVGRRPSGWADMVRALGGAQAAIAAAESVLDGHLLKRFRHVVGEADRVAQAVDQLRAADPVAFGHLMDVSHTSLRVDYLVSTAELDELVELAIEGGAYGARLTGAGLGGCVVALADRGSVDGVLEALAGGYFAERGLRQGLEGRLFIAVPSVGASFRPVGSAGA